MLRQLIEVDQGTIDLLLVEPGLRLGAVAHGRTGERDARHALGEAARDRAADGAEAGNGDAGLRHEASH